MNCFYVYSPINNDSLYFPFKNVVFFLKSVIMDLLFLKQLIMAHLQLVPTFYLICSRAF